MAGAEAFEGKHPNIDRLLAWAAGNESYGVRLEVASHTTPGTAGS